MRIPGKTDNIIAVIVCAAFLLQPFGQTNSCAQELVLPMPGTMVQLSVPAVPTMLKGIKVHPENPFHLDFILDRGSETSSAVKRESNLAKEDYLKEESTKIIKYFLAALTTPEKDLWVNLSPYEKDRIVPESFGQTEMGRDLLAQDYLLKQITASLVYPEGDLGKQFWKRVYELTANKNVPINTFNKVWIVPDKAVVYENAKNGTAYVVESSLKVLTEQDYLALDKNAAGGAQAVRFARSLRGTMALSPATPRGDGLSEDERNSWATGPAHAIRDLVIPQLTKEVNTGANFAQLRQVYNSLILATWYKKKIQDNIIAQVYADKNKIKGTEFDDPLSTRTIYERYLQAFKKGTYNFIKEEKDPVSQQVIPRKYFSGGWSGHVDLNVVTNPDAAMTNSMLSDKRLMRINLILQSSTQDPAMQSLREKHFVKRFIRVSGRNVRISEIFNVPLTPQEEQVVIDKIQRDPNFKAVLLKEDVLKDALAKKHGRIQLVLNEDAGIIPKNHLGSTVTLGVSVGALMTDEDPIDWKSLSEKNIVRVNPTGYLFIKVRGHYLLTFNQGALNEGELLLSPPGGGYWFADKDGRQLFYQHMALSRSLDRDEPLSMRRIISGRDLELFVTMFDSTQGREAAPYRELVQELVGPHSETGGVFDHVPVSWQNTVAKIVDAAQIVEAGKKLSKIDGDRGNYSFNVLEYEYLLSDEFKGLRDEIIRWGYFYWESFRFTNPMILAFDGTELVGALKASYKDRKTVVGTGITVKPDHRGRGVGIRLFIHMTEFLKSKGIDVYRIKFENTQEAQGVARYVETVFAGNVQVVKDAGGNITEVSISPRLFDAPKAMSLLKSGDPVDAGMTAPGGIDLNADNLTLQTKSQGGQIKFHADPALLARFKDAPGLMPVIMNIQPLDDLKVFLGL